MMNMSSQSGEDFFEEILALVDEFDAADLNDITQRVESIEWCRLRNDYKEQCDKAKKWYRKAITELQERSIALSELEETEKSLKEQNNSLKVQIGNANQQLDAISEAGKKLLRKEDEIHAELQKLNDVLNAREIEKHELQQKALLIRKKLILRKLELRRYNPDFFPRSGDISCKNITSDIESVVPANCSQVATESMSNSRTIQWNLSSAKENKENADCRLLDSKNVDESSMEQEDSETVS
ncbi:unnamed protein product [Anisakis simplex]|uniref:Nuclear distribution protein nudE-like 1-B n=1 Tax=Anisakis simplex TaxID=6269 RepID=A0A0M3JWN2_ANISI|nr:unnamed protein product [Anisakis simplex]